MVNCPPTETYTILTQMNPVPSAICQPKERKVLLNHQGATQNYKENKPKIAT
jgi:hypothetical protein